MKNQPVHANRGLKTVLIYVLIVFIIALISLSIKAVFIYQQNVFDGKHQFVLGFTQDKKVQQIVVFSPKRESVVIFSFEKKDSQESFIKAHSIIPDGWVGFKDEVPFDNGIKDTLQRTFWGINKIETEITIFDIGRALFFVKRIPEVNKTNILLTEDMSEREKEKEIRRHLQDPVIAEEQQTVQIINASGVPGLGGRLASVLENMGSNVVSVITARSKESESTVAYYGEETYTIQKITRLLSFPSTSLSEETIADIVITIGEDERETNKF